MHLSSLLNALKVALHEQPKSRVRFPRLFHECDAITKSKAILEEE